MSQMLPDGEVMRRGAAPAPRASPAAPDLPPNANTKLPDNKELLRQQLLSASKDRQQRPAPSPRPRQKNRWKLKFHHQALPQEYLDHYEQTLQKADQRAQKKQEKPKPEADSNITNETFKIWAQRLAGIQNEAQTTVQDRPKTEERRRKPSLAPSLAPSKVITYDDLPYMGEMTLNNSKPRRGRKPKKADICHLIYENYGTVVPGQPTSDKLTPPCPAFRPEVGTPKTDLQNKIISSLLERKLSAESRRRQQFPPRGPLPSPGAPAPPPPLTRPGPLHSDDEPLNLCIRDLYDLKIQIQKKFGNIYSSAPEVKAEPDDRSEQPNAISVIQRNTNLSTSVRSSPSLPRSSAPSPALSEPAGTGAGGQYVCWTPAGLYLHPLALQTQLLYYQKLAAAGQLPLSPEQNRLSTPNSVSESASTEPSSPALDDNKNKLVLKQISELLDPNVMKQTEEKSPELKLKRSSPNPNQGAVKRKRSAIFIPPVPANTNSSTAPKTEVSICKFKFTGGSKPTLQEKKMLSVDSGGNFTYYSGTGKGNKGYEYMQRDASRRAEASAAETTAAPSEELLSKEDLSKKKRKSRKSLQREKLEQTFREKGFLIQTQQLQSAEGATYCKFRQLRKFTRYLFRSWKDYLPGELEERGNGEANQHHDSEQKQLEAPPPTEGAAVGEWG